MEIKSLGGSGENARNCFLIRDEKYSIMLDCGVCRELSDTSKVYPSITPEIAEELDFVFLSHAHEDHSAALPYLYSLGFTGTVYTSEDTAKACPDFLKKWVSYNEKHGVKPPFENTALNAVKFSILTEHNGVINTPDGQQIRYTTGRSGHSLGSLWIQFQFESGKVLYTGDYTTQALLLDNDPLPKTDVLIVDSAYASRFLNQEKQYQALANAVRQCTKAGGCALLPVPSNGRGIDILYYLLLQKLPVVAEPTVLRQARLWSDKRNALKLEMKQVIDNYTATDCDSIAGKAILTPDGMMTSDTALGYFEKIRNNERNLTIISGHTSDGTMGRLIQEPSYRDFNGIKCKVENITIKVHPDEEDVVSIVKATGSSKVMLFHGLAASCENLKSKISAFGCEVVASVSDSLSV